jgi:hypothetical protein
MMAKIKNPYNTTVMTGTIMAIKLAVKPRVLPDLSDILAPKLLISMAN